MKRINYLAIAFLTAGAAAAEGTGRLQFVWANPTASAPCGLSESTDPAGGTALRVAGTIEAQELGMACIVQIPRRKFDALYRFCTVTYADSQERDQYACWVQYSPKQVTFLYSYSPEAVPGPACSFACTRK